jgi:hypothetical protein
VQDKLANPIRAHTQHFFLIMIGVLMNNAIFIVKVKILLRLFNDDVLGLPPHIVC